MRRDAPLDAEGILRALAQHGVEYVIIGGLAVQTHGHVRTTVDIDVLPRPGPSNMARLADALNALEARILNPGSEDLKIDATVHSGLLKLTRRGWLGVIARGGSKVVIWMAQKGLRGPGAIATAIGRLKS